MTTESPPILWEETNKTGSYDECEACHGAIRMGEPHWNLSGKRFHRKCLPKSEKLVTTTAQTEDSTDIRATDQAICNLNELRSELRAINNQLEFAECCSNGALVTQEQLDKKCAEFNAKFTALDTKYARQGSDEARLRELKQNPNFEAAVGLLQDIDTLREQTGPIHHLSRHAPKAMIEREAYKMGFLRGLVEFEALLAGGKPADNGNGSRSKWGVPFDGQAA